MNLPINLQNFKLPNVEEGSRHFFCINNAKDWDFEKYYEETHHDLNKSKNFKKIQSDYDRDLDWIANLRNIPSAIAEYARHLAKEAKPSKAQLKADLAKRATKKRKTTNKGIIIKGPIYGGTVNATVNNAVSNAEGSGSRPEPVMNNERDVDEIPASIGKEWLRFIEKHQTVFHPFSPVANKIIRSGSGISPRPYLDRDLYYKHLEEHEVEQYPLPAYIQEKINPAIDANGLSEYKRELRKISALLLEDEETVEKKVHLEFIEEFLSQT